MTQHSKRKRTHKQHFSEDTMQSFRELGIVIDRIYRRLKAEGYIIVGNKLYKDGVIIDEL